MCRKSQTERVCAEEWMCKSMRLHVRLYPSSHRSARYGGEYTDFTVGWEARCSVRGLLDSSVLSVTVNT